MKVAVLGLDCATPQLVFDQFKSLRTCMRSGKKEGKRWTMLTPQRIDQTSPWEGQGGCPHPKWACRDPPNVGDNAWAGENCWR